ncbi:MAG TPA: hypothetical protein VKR52_00660 [Terracidiphilus sp.]|nr:hypothetical protein [Terracidiphilus sp.]
MDAQEDRSNNSVSIFLIVAGFALLLVATILIFESRFLYGILLAIVALMVGLIGFNRIEEANRPAPQLYWGRDTVLFDSETKMGAPFYVHFEINWLPGPGPASTLEIIQTRIQKWLFEYGSKINALPNDAMTEIENAIRVALPSLEEELGLEQIKVNVIRAKVGRSGPQTGFHQGV